MTRKPLVYIAAKYRGTEIHNIRRAIVTARHIRRRMPVVTLIPHLSGLEDLVMPESQEYWLAETMDQMLCCDAVYRMEGDSEGADAEVATAMTHGIPVFFDVFELEKWVKTWSR